MISSLFADMRFGARAISQRPGFAAVVVLTLACGIGVNVALFSLFQQILLRPLPVAEADRLVNLSDPGPKLDPRAAAGGAGESTPSSAIRCSAISNGRRNRSSASRLTGSRT
jgi:hypothetical protein